MSQFSIGGWRSDIKRKCPIFVYQSAPGGGGSLDENGIMFQDFKRRDRHHEGRCDGRLAGRLSGRLAVHLAVRLAERLPGRLAV